MRQVYLHIIKARTSNMEGCMEIVRSEADFIRERYVQDLLETGALFNYKPALQERYWEIIRSSFDSSFTYPHNAEITDEVVGQFSVAIGITEESTPVDCIAAIDDCNHIVFPTNNGSLQFFGRLMTRCLEQILIKHYDGQLTEDSGKTRIITLGDKQVNTFELIDDLIRTPADIAMYQLVIELEQEAGRPAPYAVSSLQGAVSAMVTNVDEENVQFLTLNELKQASEESSSNEKDHQTETV